MERIIMDSWIKQNKQIYGKDRDHIFNRRILAVNDMYGWLKEQGILEKIAFVYQDCPTEVHFALDTKDLEPYRKAMEDSGLPQAGLAIQHLLDEEYTPCVYSGAIQIGWLMDSYREMDGMVGRSWECDLVKFLNAKAVTDIRRVQEGDGVKAAVQKTFSYYQWPEMQKEESREHTKDLEQDEQEVWITVYRDVLGQPEREDNLTEICLPKAWLMKELKEENLHLDSWFDTYTADDTEEIARKAMEEGKILQCSDPTIPIGKTSSLHTVIRSAADRVQERKPCTGNEKPKREREQENPR